jgi:hypothetical protein
MIANMHSMEITRYEYRVLIYGDDSICKVMDYVTQIVMKQFLSAS